MHYIPYINKSNLLKQDVYSLSDASSLTECLLIILDEPVSPSVDREAAPIPPSAVISVAPSITTGASSPSSPCPAIRRQLSHDQGKQYVVGWVT